MGKTSTGRADLFVPRKCTVRMRNQGHVPDYSPTNRIAGKPRSLSANSNFERRISTWFITDSDADASSRVKCLTVGLTKKIVVLFAIIVQRNHHQPNEIAYQWIDKEKSFEKIKISNLDGVRRSTLIYVMNRFINFAKSTVSSSKKIILKFNIIFFFF